MEGRKLLVRHALSGANLEGVIQGQRNTPLRHGYKTTVDRLAGLVIDQEHLDPQPADVYVVSSPLDRAYYTAERIHRGLTERKVQAELRRFPELTERGAGILEGLTYVEAIPIIEEALRRSNLPVPVIKPNARDVYPYLFSLDNIPGGEKNEILGDRLQYTLDQLEQLRGIVIIVGHGISGKNDFKNLMTDGNILGNPARSYQHFENLAVTRLQKIGGGRYVAAEPYGPPNGTSGANGSPLPAVTATLVKAS